MRLLYVALTRAEHRLILAGTASRKRIEEKWPKRARLGAGPAEILAGGSFLDWLGSWPPGGASLENSGQNKFFTWTVFDEEHPWLAPAKPPAAQAREGMAEADLSPETRARLDWRYPFEDDTKIAAKAAVSTLRRGMAGEDQEEARLFTFDTSARKADGTLSAADLGSAHHTFLEKMTLDPTPTLESLTAEAARLRNEKLLTPEECASLDLDALAAFWRSETGRQLLDWRPALRRELAFTARLETTALAQLGSADFAGAAPGEFIVVQGVIDLAAILPEEIWLLDFKTDHFPVADLDEKIKMYRPQIELYAAALGGIYRRPVTRRWLHFLAHGRTVAI